MKTRIILGALMIAAVAGLLWLDWHIEQAEEAGHQWADRLPLGLPLVPLVVALTGVAFWEIARLARACQVRLLFVSGLIGALVLALFPFLGGLTVMISLTSEGSMGTLFRFLGGMMVMFPCTPEGLMAMLGGLVLMVFAEQMIRRRSDDALRSVAGTMLAVVYLGVGGAMVLNIRYEFHVPGLVLFLAAVKVTDIGAYFVGSAIGRHKLAPSISPGKTWEGLAGGLAAGAAAAVLVTWLLPGIEMKLGHAAIFGVVTGLAGQFADLCESALKRSAGAKDSGHAVPSFGGVLDIVDSPLLAAPIAWLLMQELTAMAH